MKIIKFIFFELFITILLLEGGLRIYEKFNPKYLQNLRSNSDTYKIRLLIEDSLVYFNKPNFAWENDYFKIQTNKYGMRGPDIDINKSNKKRLGVFGDSFTFGCWASNYEKSFVGIVAKNLSTKNIEVLNFGCSGYGFDAIYYLIKSKATDFNLDYILLASFNGNDFRDTYLGVKVLIL